MITFKNISSGTMKKLAQIEMEYPPLLRHEELEFAVGLLLRNRELLDTHEMDSCIKSLMEIVEQKRNPCLN